VLRKPFAPAFGFKNTQVFPRRAKTCSVSGFALLSLLERNRARSAFKRFFSPISLRKIEVLISLGQSLRVFDALSLIYSASCYHGFGDASMVRRCAFGERPHLDHFQDVSHFFFLGFQIFDIVFVRWDFEGHTFDNFQAIA
jgi:hypothetical protein